MEVIYDTRTDALSVILKDNASIVEGDEEKPGVILDYDEGVVTWSLWRSWTPPGG